MLVLHNSRLLFDKQKSCSKLNEINENERNQNIKIIEDIRGTYKKSIDKLDVASQSDLHIEQTDIICTLSKRIDSLMDLRICLDDHIIAIAPRENVATIKHGAIVIEGNKYGHNTDASTALLDGNINWDTGVWNVLINGNITIKLNQIYLLDSMAFVLWHGDNERLYSYSIEVSRDGVTWIKLDDYSFRK
uniref:F5/8 type C domain-containing protein n=1 Tax=Acrobeloides nanus TaxID=290746 RepID=A0A914E936_9BILA